MTTTQAVPAKSLDKALDFIRNGGRLVIPTCTQIMVLDRKCLARFEKAGEWLLKEDGDSYRVRRGRKSDYLLPGQLKFVIE